MVLKDRPGHASLEAKVSTATPVKGMMFPELCSLLEQHSAETEPLTNELPRCHTEETSYSSISHTHSGPVGLGYEVVFQRYSEFIINSWQLRKTENKEEPETINTVYKKYEQKSVFMTVIKTGARRRRIIRPCCDGPVLRATAVPLIHPAPLPLSLGLRTI